MRHLGGRTALLTGASRGIGPHIAHALAREGVHLALTARSKALLDGVAASVQDLGVRAVVIPGDVAVRDDRERIVAQAADRLGAIDILVNNAAIESEGGFTTLDADTISRTVDTNLTGPLHLARLVLPDMLGRRVGHIVNVSSLSGKKGTPYEAVYSATKAGLIEWTHALRIELRGSGVSASAVCPGYVTGTGMFARFGIAPLWIVGSCTPGDVARAIMRAIRWDAAEIIVNSIPVRAALALNTLFPGLGDRMMTGLGITAFQKRKVSRIGASRPPGSGE